jgi:adenosylcobyric acid synthase
MKGKAIMVQGTSSNCGKSVLVASLCKIFADEGYRVAPFKAQNMSLNSYVTLDGKEIARAQALQAFAAEVEPIAEMNPILLKPKDHMSSQVILLGKPYMDINARNYYKDFALSIGLKVVKESLEKLLSNYEIVVIEGAGSPAEINILDRDIANMRVAKIANSPVILIADIDRGGVFASIYGTIMLLGREDRELIKGIVINKFRGEISILKSGLRIIEKLTSKKVIGVLPYLNDLILPSEDSVFLESVKSMGKGMLRVCVINLPRISNFTDFEPLALAGVNVYFADRPEEIKRADLIIIPGSKNTVKDLTWLRENGFEDAIKNERSDGKIIIGICAGYQILGEKIIDPYGIEGGEKGGEYKGFGFLRAKTSFESYNKKTIRVRAKVFKDNLTFLSYPCIIEGYEIHMGVIKRGQDKPFANVFKEGLRNVNRIEGSVSDDGLVLGTQIHGLFDLPNLTNQLINYLAKRKGVKLEGNNKRSIFEIWLYSLNKLAKVVKENLDISYIYSLIR